MLYTMLLNFVGLDLLIDVLFKKTI